jgi:hypothetical protein
VPIEAGRQRNCGGFAASHHVAGASRAGQTQGETLLKSLRSRLTFSNVISMVALCIAMGGVSYAAVSLPKNSVGPTQIRKHAVKPNKLAGNSVRKRALARGIRKQLHRAPARIHFSADAEAGSPLRTIGKIGGLTLRAACRSAGGGTRMIFGFRSTRAGTIQENFQNDFGSDPHSPGTMNPGNLQIDVPVGSAVIGGPPPVTSGNYFRTIANLVFTTKRDTSTLTVATIANDATQHCNADGLGFQASR